MPALIDRAAARVLVIDDNREAADSLCYLLGLWGFDARPAYGGEEGLHAAAEFHPCFVVCDLAMPGVSGFEVARKLRALLSTAALLVALTAYGNDDYRAKAAEAGFDRYLVKPADPIDIRSML